MLRFLAMVAAWAIVVGIGALLGIRPSLGEVMLIVIATTVADFVREMME